MRKNQSFLKREHKEEKYELSEQKKDFPRMLKRVKVRLTGTGCLGRDNHESFFFVSLVAGTGGAGWGRAGAGLRGGGTQVSSREGWLWARKRPSSNLPSNRQALSLQQRKGRSRRGEENLVASVKSIPTGDPRFSCIASCQG